MLQYRSVLRATAYRHSYLQAQLTADNEPALFQLLCCALVTCCGVSEQIGRRAREALLAHGCIDKLPTFRAWPTDDLRAMLALQVFDTAGKAPQQCEHMESCLRSTAEVRLSWHSETRCSSADSLCPSRQLPAPTTGT